jgi:hypothetical protein
MTAAPESLPLSADLEKAGMMIDKAVEYLFEQNIAPEAIASALLGGAVDVLGRSMSDETVVRVLENAIASVRAGHLRRPGG